MSFLSKIFGNSKTISPQKAHELMETEENLIILDVRTKDEYKNGRIKNSLLIPIDELSVRAEKELKDKQAKILIYCHSGARAGSAVQVLTSMGYTDVTSFGGIISWPFEIVKG